jgi:hypothetical protein
MKRPVGTLLQKVVMVLDTIQKEKKGPIVLETTVKV